MLPSPLMEPAAVGSGSMADVGPTRRMVFSPLKGPGCWLGDHQV